MFDVKKIRKDFPIFDTYKDLVYLDSAATSQKPNEVINSIKSYYETSNANVHRGVYALSEKATDMYEASRKKVATFIGAKNASEVIFTSGVTHSLNTIAFGYVYHNLKKDDEILIVDADHHSNIVPWQIVARSIGAKIKVIHVDDNGLVNLKKIENEINEKTRFMAISHASNVLGTIFPVKDICEIAKKSGIIVSVDGAQAIPHLPINVAHLGCDFYSFSGHKMLGPMGIGVLWGTKEVLEETQPFEYGGGMIDEVFLDNTTFGPIPERFEAGTPNVEGAVGLASAIDYLNSIGMDFVRDHELDLITYALFKLQDIPGIRILGPKEANDRCGLVAFVVDGIHPHDLASILSEEDIAVRSGQHCAMPLHDILRIPASVRASFYIYNDKSDVDKLVLGIEKARRILL